MNLILSILLLAITCNAQYLQHRRSAFRSIVASGACATTDTDIPHDELLEGWTGASEENTWSSSITPAGRTDLTYDNDADTSSLTSGKPAGACNEAFHFKWAATNATISYYIWDRGSAITVSNEIDLEFYIYPITNGLSGNIGVITMWSAVDGQSRAMAIIATSGGQWVISAYGATASSTTTITHGTWHRIKIHTDIAGDATGSYIQVNGGSQKTFQRAASYGVRYVTVGAPGYLTIGDTGEYYIDVIGLNTP